MDLLIQGRNPTEVPSSEHVDWGDTIRYEPNRYLGKYRYLTRDMTTKTSKAVTNFYWPWTDVKTQTPLLKQDVVSWKQRQSQPLHKEQSDFMMHPATMKKLGPSEILKKRTIRVLPNEYENRYELLEPIPVDFENIGPSAVIASFLEAELSVTGYDVCDAEADLMSWIIDMYDDLTSADPRTLGKVPAKQKRILRRHLRHSR